MGLFRNILFVFFFGFVLGGSLSGAEKKKEGEIIHSLEKKSWDVGFCRLEGLGLDASFRYLLRSLPMLLKDELADISSHRFSENELAAYRQQYLDEGLFELQKKKSSLHNSRDKILFAQESPENRRKKYDKITGEIWDNQEETEAWERLLPRDVLVPEEAAVAFIQPEKGDNFLWSPRKHYRKFMENKKLDLLIYGSLEKNGEDFFLSLKALESHEDKAVYTFEGQAGETGLEKLIFQAADGLRTVMLGRSWAALTVRTVPEDGVITIDGISCGIGYFHSKNLKPGFVTLEAGKPGRLPEHRQVYLTAFSSTELSLELPPGEKETLFIASVPPGADVYRGALWLGQTPLTIPRPGDASWIKVSKDEFMPFMVSASKIKGDSLTVELDSEILDKTFQLKKAKKKFYRSLGWFSISLGLPVVLSGIYQNLENRYYANADAYSRTGSKVNYDDAMRTKEQAQAFFYGYWGSVALSSGLFVNLMFKLKNYIKAAGESTEDQ